jgi:hypothetical protein
MRQLLFLDSLSFVEDSLHGAQHVMGQQVVRKGSSAVPSGIGIVVLWNYIDVVRLHGTSQKIHTNVQEFSCQLTFKCSKSLVENPVGTGH